MNVPVLVLCFVAGVLVGALSWRGLRFSSSVEDAIVRRFGLLSLPRQRALLAQLQMELQMREERTTMISG
jgi:hypothetical protein